MQKKVLYTSISGNYDEADICIKIGKDKKKLILKQMQKLQSSWFPKNHGLFENNIIFRNHLHIHIIKFSDEWWQEYQIYSKRDQLSFVYFLWKNRLTCIPFFEDEFEIRNHPYFRYLQHQKGIKNKIN